MGDQEASDPERAEGKGEEKKERKREERKEGRRGGTKLRTDKERWERADCILKEKEKGGEGGKKEGEGGEKGKTFRK